MILYRQKLTVMCCITAFPQMSQARTGDKGCWGSDTEITRTKAGGGRVEWDVVQVMVNASGLAQKVSIFDSL